MSHAGTEKYGIDVEQTKVCISVVVPFHNSERYIENCIQALLEQSYPWSLYEVIMIDNNSTDGSVRIVRKYPRIKVLSERKQGAYAARNRGIIEAQGSIIAFTDPDCIPASDWLEQIDMAMRRPATKMVIGRQYPGKHSPILQMLEDYENEKNEYVFKSTRNSLYYGHTNNMAVRRTVLKELGPFVEMARGSDTILVRRCVDRHSCDSVYYAPNIRVRHMEIEGAWSYFRKTFIYGKSIKHYGPIANARAITTRERFVVFRNTINKQKYSWPKSGVLLVFLLVGLVHWNFGSIGAVVSSPHCRVRKAARGLVEKWFTSRA